MQEKDQALILDDESTARAVESASIVQGVAQGVAQNINQNNNYQPYGNHQYQYGQNGQYQQNGPYNYPNPNNYQGQPPQGYGNMPPPPPLYNAPIPADLLNHPAIVHIQQNIALACPVCGALEGYARRTAGCTAFSWCVCLFIFTGFFCCWLPFCMPNCYDVEVVCARCGYVKILLQANLM